MSEIHFRIDELEAQNQELITDIDRLQAENEMLKGNAADKFAHMVGCKEPVMGATCLSCEDVKWAKLFAEEAELKAENKALLMERAEIMEIQAEAMGYNSVGDHAPLTMADAAAKAIASLRQQVAQLEAEAELGNIPYREAVALRERVGELEAKARAFLDVRFDMPTEYLKAARELNEALAGKE